MKCKLMGLYNTLRYGLFKLEIISGHQMQFTNETWLDYWVMKCHRCGDIGYAEVGPDGEWEEL